MASGPTDEPARPPGLRDRLFERGLALLEVVTGRSEVRRVRRVVDRYDAAGGALVANGLAFTALFALVPAALLVLGLAGLVVGRSIADVDVDALPVRLPEPLGEAFATVVTELARDAGTLSIIGLVALVWGVSRFNSALEVALARVFHEAPRRGFVRRTAFSLLAVLALVGAVVGAILLAGAVSLFEELVVVGGRPLVDVVPSRVLSTAVSAAVGAVGVAAVYRFVPTARPGWGATVVPAVVVAVSVTVLTQVFVYIAPRLVGAAAVLGSAAAVFAALAWFSLVFQMLLVGAAWTAERADRSAVLAGPAAATEAGGRGK